MTAAQFARLLNARKCGKDTWRAFCPAHGSRHHRTLQIKQGNRGILLRCWSMGCSPASITASMGLEMRDLFSGPPPDKDTLRKLEEIQAESRRQKQMKQRIRVEAMRMGSVWEEAQNRLAKLLVLYPSEHRIASLFHRALGYARRCESIAIAYGSPGPGFPPMHVPPESGFPTRKLDRKDVGTEIANRIGL